MSAVQSLTVSSDEADLRLDRWFKRRFPALGHGRLEKLLRTGQVRVDGKRAKANLRLAAGQIVRVPPGADAPAPDAPAKRAPPRVSAADADFVRSLVIHRDADVIALNKPPGLAVQGGTGTHRHLDGMLDALRFEAPDRPRLVHRLDRDTSGVLLLGRSARAAAKLAETFRGKTARKLYWALVAGAPKPPQGKIDLALAKEAGAGGERMARDDEAGQRAITLYATIDAAADRAAWLVMWPLTGRTHQLRVHAAEGLRVPIVGDGKYGGPPAFLTGSVSRKLHLHARSIALPHPSGQGELRVTAKLPPHMRETWELFGFDAGADIDPFEE
ncbi:MAG TPA: RluA family pseudouridine synthase [Alphaproteobacteria bacterium]